MNLQIPVKSANSANSVIPTTFYIKSFGCEGKDQEHNLLPLSSQQKDNQVCFSLSGLHKNAEDLQKGLSAYFAGLFADNLVSNKSSKPNLPENFILQTTAEKLGIGADKLSKQLYAFAEIEQLSNKIQKESNSKGNPQDVKAQKLTNEINVALLENMIATCKKEIGGTTEKLELTNFLEVLGSDNVRKNDSIIYGEYLKLKKEIESLKDGALNAFKTDVKGLSIENSNGDTFNQFTIEASFTRPQ